MTRLVVDPVTRVSGALRIEVEIQGGVVADAWASGTMYRGIERVLHGRDPRDAWLFTQRICGSCDSVHALGAVRAVENALGITIPGNARILRNMMAAIATIVSHVVHFYHRGAFDWIDAVAAAGADPTRTSDLAHKSGALPRSSVATYQAVRDRVARVLQSNQRAPFGAGWWGHPAYALSPEASLMLLSHYMDALEWQRRAMRIHAILGGKSPHPQTYLVGGMAVAPVWGGPNLARTGQHPALPDKDSLDAFSERGQREIANLITEIRTFVEQVYAPDVRTLVGAYPDWAVAGSGTGNYLASGDYPLGEGGAASLLFPRGRLMDRDLERVYSVEQEVMRESTAGSWYAEPAGTTEGRHPWDEAAAPAYAGPPIDPAAGVASFAGSARYSWVKAPRYAGQAMEVGPVARMLVALATPTSPLGEQVEGLVREAGMGRAALASPLGRTVARSIEARLLATRLAAWQDEIADRMAGGDLAMADITRWAPESWPGRARGHALVEGPRGMVGHWVDIEDRTIRAWQVVDASTWNVSPRDEDGRRGPLEQALIGTPVADPRRPLEILRAVHAFDPCTACAVHAHSPAGGSPIEVTIR